MNVTVRSVVLSTGVAVQKHFRREQDGDGFFLRLRVELRMEVGMVLLQQAIAGTADLFARSRRWDAQRRVVTLKAFTSPISRG